MNEGTTMESIMGRMLDRIPNDLDKREGSIIYDALAPAAAELAQLYIELDLQLRFAYGTTSSGEYLALRTADYGVDRQLASPSRREGLFFGRGDEPLDVPIGSRYSAEDLIYVVREKMGSGVFVLECETPGAAGNTYYGPLLPVDYVNGLDRAELGDVLVPGEDDESDEALRARYLHRVRNPSSGGNAADYRDWAMSVAGVGGAKVYPLWDGPGTVKVVIVDSDKRPASPTLVAETAGQIETKRPIGAAVTVVSASAAPITVTSTVVLAAGYTLQAVTDAFAAALETHFRSIAFSASYVSIAGIGVLLLSVPGVLDYTGLTLNGGTGNVALDDEEIPTLAGAELGV
ncbi:baseplate J protein [Paenibacillus agaridevorans]|uniref:Baseplate J protein n=1 Tax=Paenibacillus agaridevorans TaxID=171404 RepID=A0A2R5F444_9BACL|nr:baseplate J/gp47 family protein [Paenibacillus agaridevorans]GBG11333.1 baseplate J protein [Paenibacillus agaridevorans]